jgi:hypothetical protein
MAPERWGRQVGGMRAVFATVGYQTGPGTGSTSARPEALPLPVMHLRTHDLSGSVKSSDRVCLLMLKGDPKQSGQYGAMLSFTAEALAVLINTVSERCEGERSKGRTHGGNTGSLW